MVTICQNIFPNYLKSKYLSKYFLKSKYVSVKFSPVKIIAHYQACNFLKLCCKPYRNGEEYG